MTFASRRDDIHVLAASLAERIDTECIGSGEVVRIVDQHLMGSSEDRGQLATQPGYTTIYVAGRHRGEITRQVLSQVYGTDLDRLDIVEHFPAAMKAVERVLRERAAKAGMDPNEMVNGDGESKPIAEVADRLCRAAVDRLSGRGRAISVASIMGRALEGVPDPARQS